jgi:hypothetical protein
MPAKGDYRAVDSLFIHTTIPASPWQKIVLLGVSDTKSNGFTTCRVITMAFGILSREREGDE